MSHLDSHPLTTPTLSHAPSSPGGHIWAVIRYPHIPKPALLDSFLDVPHMLGLRIRTFSSGQGLTALRLCASSSSFGSSTQTSRLHNPPADPPDPTYGTNIAYITDIVIVTDDASLSIASVVVGFPRLFFTSSLRLLWQVFVS